MANHSQGPFNTVGGHSEAKYLPLPLQKYWFSTENIDIYFEFRDLNQYFISLTSGTYGFITLNKLLFLNDSHKDIIAEKMKNIYEHVK